MTTRFPHGVGTLDGDHIHTDWERPYKPAFHQHIEEFGVYHSQPASDPTPYTEDWVEFYVGAGANTRIPTLNGALSMVTGANANDLNQTQYAISDVSPSAAIIHYTFGYNPNNPGDDDIVSFGLAENVGDAAFSPTAQGYYFVLQQLAPFTPSTIAFHIVGASITTILSDLGQIESEFQSFQFHIDNGKGELLVGYQSAIIASLNLNELASGALPTAILGFSASIETLSTPAASMQVDFMWEGNARGYVT